MDTVRTIEDRADALLCDPARVVELLEEIQEAGGLTHRSLCAALRVALVADRASVAYRCAIDRALDLLREAALMRVLRESSTRSLH